MARIHGRGSLLYLQGSGANAIPFSNAADYDQIDSNKALPN